MKIGSGSTAEFLRFSYDASGNVVAVDYSEDDGTSFTTYYYLRNAQNDIVKLIDGSGNTVVEYTYDSWGSILSATGSLRNTLGKYQPFCYRGYVYDSVIGLYYLQSRYYDPEIGRFISSDVYLSTGQGVIGHNSFAYCLNNPVMLSDDCGNIPSHSVTIDNPDKKELDPLPKTPPDEYSIIFLGQEYFSSIDTAVISWCNEYIPQTQNDHLERCGIIVYVWKSGKKYYSVVSTGTGNNETCWKDFLNGYFLQMINPLNTVEGFVHIHTAYYNDNEWKQIDLGPSVYDLSLFFVPFILTQYLANESGEIYRYDVFSNKWYLVKSDKKPNHKKKGG